MHSTVTPGGRAPGGASSLVCTARVVIALQPTRPEASGQERPIARGSSCARAGVTVKGKESVSDVSIS
jgi:hypothetical protein